MTKGATGLLHTAIETLQDAIERTQSMLTRGGGGVEKGRNVRVDREEVMLQRCDTESITPPEGGWEDKGEWGGGRKRGSRIHAQ
jgi:hypothetical protein